MKEEEEVELMRLADNAGKNHLNSKINEMIDLHGEIINKEITSQHEILKLITDKISMYQNVVKDRYL